MVNFVSRNKTIHLGKITSSLSSKTVDSSLTSYRNLPGSRRCEREKEPMRISFPWEQHASTCIYKQILFKNFLKSSSSVFKWHQYNFGEKLRPTFEGLLYLGSFKDKVMDDNLLFIREAQSVFADKGHSKGLTVHGFLTTWPVHKLIFCLEKWKNTLLQPFRYLGVTEKSSGSKNCFDK